MVRDDDPDILVLELGNDILDILHGNRVHTRERLVQKNELRVDGKSPRYLATPSLTSGELDSETLPDLGQIELVNQRLETLLTLLPGHVGKLHHGHDIVLHGHLPEDRRLLGQISDTLLGTLEHRQAGNLLVVEEYPSVIRNYLACNHIETGGLAGSVRPEKSHDLALAHLHGDALDDSPHTVFLDKIFTMKLHRIL